MSNRLKAALTITGLLAIVIAIGVAVECGQDAAPVPAAAAEYVDIRTLPSLTFRAGHYAGERRLEIVARPVQLLMDGGGRLTDHRLTGGTLTAAIDGRPVVTTGWRGAFTLADREAAPAYSGVILADLEMPGAGTGALTVHLSVDDTDVAGMTIGRLEAALR